MLEKKEIIYNLTPRSMLS